MLGNIAYHQKEVIEYLMDAEPATGSFDLFGDLFSGITISESPLKGTAFTTTFLPVNRTLINLKQEAKTESAG